MEKRQKSIGKKFDFLKEQKEKEAEELYKKINQYPLQILPSLDSPKELVITRLSNSSNQIMSL